MITRAPLGEVAPAKAIKLSIHSKDPVWQVTLDHIESHTGRLVEYETKPFSEVGSSTHGFDQRHVLYSKLRPYLNKVLVPEKQGVGTTELVPMVPDPARLDRRYLAHYLMSHNFVTWISERVSGAKMPRAVMSDLWAHEIPLPPLPEQKRIAAILDKADELRAKRREAIAELDKLVQATFLDMFGDPVTNPKGWETKHLSDVVRSGTIVTYGIVQAGDEYPGGVPYIRTGDLVGGEIRQDELRHTSPAVAAKFERSKVSAKDIVMSIRATVGTTAVVPPSLDGANLTQGTAKISPGENVELQYLLNYIRSAGCQNWIQRQVKGATFREITLKRLRELPVLMPPRPAQRSFAVAAEQIAEMKHGYLNHLSEVNALFSSLKHRAFNGDL